MEPLTPCRPGRTVGARIETRLARVVEDPTPVAPAARSGRGLKLVEDLQDRLVNLVAPAARSGRGLKPLFRAREKTRRCRPGRTVGARIETSVYTPALGVMPLEISISR